MEEELETNKIIAEELSETIVLNEEDVIPSIVFIVPYRDREQHQKFFDRHMREIVLENTPPSKYKIYYIHQCDNREFNRGALKNIGFIVVKNKYPNDYKNITLVFNDVDTMPYTANFLNYETQKGLVKHFYGYKFALGGIVSINAEDFEKIKGYPNFWAWGYEDNLINNRALIGGLTIDRSQFYPILDKNILQLKDGYERIINRDEYSIFKNNTQEGWEDINQLEYEIKEENGFVNVNNFYTSRNANNQSNLNYHLLKPSPFLIEEQNQQNNKKRRGNPSIKMFM
jgi:hypothetical protein